MTEAVPSPGRSDHGRALAGAATGYLVLALVVWWHVWSTHPSSTTTCGCGDSALFLWFFAWPAHALAHGLDPFASTAMSHPGGVNLLANTSVLALGVVLAPVTWMFGPVTSMNVALLLAPALSALAMFALIRRWVDWAPAAFAAGLAYGFSPLVLVSLSDAHLMLGWAVVPPLVVLCLDELASSTRHSPAWIGVVLGLLLVVQFFVGTEVLLLLGIVGLCAAVLLALYALVQHARPFGGVRRLVVGLTVAAGTAGVLLAWPTWYALAGPAHTSGRVWPSLRLGTEGATLRAYVWPTPVSAAFSLLTRRVGGYQGPTLSGQYLGLGMIAVAVVGLVVWRRDRRLWLFGSVAVVAAILSLGTAPAAWLPWRLLAERPLLQNVIPSRFVLLVYLSLAVVLGIVVDRAHRSACVRSDVTDTPVGRSAAPPSGRERWVPMVAGLAVVVVALGPVGAYLVPTVPMVTQAVRPPRWFTTVAPRLPGHPVLLVFPVPYQLIESAMAWQAVTGFPYAMAGGGGPGGVVQRAGPERAGAEAIGRASFSFSEPRLRPGDVVAGRRALAAWGVTGVVVPDAPGLSAYDRVTSVPYAVAYVTAVTGRAPRRQAGSWVWSVHGSDIPVGPGPSPAVLAGCVALGATGTPGAIGQVASCVLAPE